MSSVAEDIAAQVARVDAIVTEALVTGDPRAAAGARDCAVLVDPPTRDYVQLIQTWQLVVLRNTSDLGIDTTNALSAVLAELEASDLPIEESRPGSRRLGPERQAVPCYIVRYTSP